MTDGGRPLLFVGNRSEIATALMSDVASVERRTTSVFANAQEDVIDDFQIAANWPPTLASLGVFGEQHEARPPLDITSPATYPGC